ncbi:hypothetical protein HUE46_11800 [Flavobacterium columnare]|uniref:hypothetical protein n=1 Tax=Flavobacterium columnare TaxID=996 RepID=UPI001781B135|nr:hypothetical protein [Flavobacterium columnare]QOG90631.1 hypothetical protein HUE41_11800 [Flavobacterium columnare]QOG93285.1 hypothetical protein HUE42_11795 [Flavobacterium columnare]QOG95952.1 hypothetical protein HUE43_11795 [Flavobacterium columnare]QOG98612.1 hypothetical protein HUE44_11795 [Flavobacterium columnare]QOH01271.1 hypothetical protein HUE45_11795 [Flavobacterium columnare]
MISIQWSQFEQNQQAKDISFESFCFQVAYLKYKDYGYFENFYNTPGSEYYLTLHSDCPELNLKAGDEIGWQVKWWFNNEENTSLTASRRDELEKGFTTTLKRHPNIKLWIICTPGSFIEDKFIELKTALANLKSDTIISHWNKDTFSNFLTQEFNKFSDVFNHYFNTSFIDFEFIKKYSQRRIEDLQKKFDTDLYTPSHYDDEVFFVMSYKAIFEAIDIKIKYLQDDLDKIEKDDSFNAEFKTFDEEYIETAQALLKKCVHISKETIRIITSGLSIEKVKTLKSILLSFDKEYECSAIILDRKIKSKEYIIDKKNWKEKHTNDTYIVPSITKLRDYLISSKEDGESCLLDFINDVNTKDIHILSSAGYGKTNIACNICAESLKKNIPAILILGSSFRKNENPKTQILEQLEISTQYTFKQFIQALNTLGLIKGIKIPIIIDGLNESKPFDDIWKSNIKDIIRDIKELDYVLLITTCRNRYVEAIFEESDITKIPNTKTLSGLTEKQRLKAIPKYFNKYNITPTSWNFNQELFVDPLLLKIFSVVNKNSENLHISLENVFVSIDRYIEEIAENSSKIESKIDKIAKKHVENQIRHFCKHLWLNSTREISDFEFNQIISPESPNQMGDLTKKLLDEGLCFQKNLRTNDETVQFTYDRVAGYAIASKVLLNNLTKSEELKDALIKLGVEKMLFNKETYHPLRQDILMSLLHLLPSKFDVQLFELFDNDSVLEEAYNNIDYFIDNPKGQEKILKNILNENRQSRNLKILFEKLLENNFKKEVHGLGDFTIKVLASLSQVEIDIHWSELIRKNKYSVFPLLRDINKFYFKSNIQVRNIEQDLYLSFLSTTSSDKSIRSLATENLFLIGKKYPDELLRLASITIPFPDINSVESIIVAICGTTLSIKDKDFTQKCLSFFETQFIPNFNNTHICIIEYIFTIQEFAKTIFDLDFAEEVLFSKENYNISIDEKIKEEIGKNIYHDWHFDLDLYDFNKYQIKGIASDHYDKRDTLPSSDCLAIILSNIQAKGYDEAIFEVINKDFQEDRTYKYGGRRGNDNLIKYSEKYLWQSYFEFVGYLVLDGRLKSENGERFRSSDNFFDPTFPRLPRKFQLITNCLFPSKDENIQDWINSEDDNLVDKFLIHNLYTDDEWVLTSLSVTQEGNNDTRINVYLTSFFILYDKIKKLENIIHSGNFHHNPISFHQIYSGEINWSNSVVPSKEDYYDDGINLKDVMRDYSWSSWSSNRFENPHFEFLNEELSNLLNLDFNPNDLCFYNKKNEQVTKIIWTENSKLYYAKKEIIEELSNQLKMEFVWNQFISKYGEFGKYKDNLLNPSYKDLSKIIRYNDII